MRFGIRIVQLGLMFLSTVHLAPVNVAPLNKHSLAIGCKNFLDIFSFSFHRLHR